MAEGDEVESFLRIEDPRSIDSGKEEESGHYFNYEETMYKTAKNNGSDSNSRPVIVSTPSGVQMRVNIGSLSKNDGSKTSGVTQMSATEFTNHVCQQLKKKEQLLQQVAKDNQTNVSKAQAHIFKMQKAFQDRLEVLHDEIASLKLRLTQQKAKNLEKDDTIRHLKGAIAKGTNLASPAPNVATKGSAQGSNNIEVIYPSVERLSKNGVFVLKQNDQTDMCVKLPIKVTLDNTKMKVVDSDIAGVSKKQVDRRREVALQTIELLFNPLSATIKESRCQHLIWILLMSLFEKYHFKDPEDKYLLGPQDRITLNSDLIIKTKREDCLETSKVWDRFHGDHSEDVPENIKEREIEIKRYLKNIHKMTHKAQGLEPPKSPKPVIIKDPTVDTQDLSSDALCQDASRGRLLVQAAFVNTSQKPCRLEAFKNILQIATIVIRDTPSPLDGGEELRVGFIPAMTDGNKIVIIPLIVKESTRSTLDTLPTTQMGKFMKVKLTKPQSKENYNAFEVNDDVKELFFPEVDDLLSCKLVEPPVKVKTELKDNSIDPEPFHCRYCEKKFTSMSGWDAHLESTHGDNLPFLCPILDCHQCYRTKTSLICHIRLCQKRVIQTEECGPVIKDTSNTPRVIDAQKPCGSKDLPECTRPAKDESPARRTRSRVVRKSSSRSMLNPLDHVDPSEVQDPIDDPMLDYIKHEPFADLPQEPEPEVVKKRKRESSASSTERSKKSRKSETVEDVKAAESAPPILAESPSVQKPKSSPGVAEYSNRASRRRKHPQVSFTASLKDFVITIVAYMKTQKVLIKKEKGKSVQWNHNLLRKIEDKVDADKYQVQSDFMNEIQSFCTNITESAEAPKKDKEVVEEFAKNLGVYCLEEMEWRLPYLNQLELQINPLLSDDPKVVFQHVLKKIVEEHVLVLRTSATFQKPVDRKNFPDYYEVIKNPLCINEILEKVNKNMYSNKNEFINDFQLVHRNSVEYNGRKSEYTQSAANLVGVVKKAFSAYKNYHMS